MTYNARPGFLSHVFYVFFRGWIEIKYCHTNLNTDVYVIKIEKNMKNVSDHSNINGNGGILVCLLMGFDGHLVEKLGTTPKQNLTKTFIFWDINLKSSSFRVKHVL